jgi:hypothetical protein
MASPTPWADAKTRLQAAQQAGLLPVIQWPNETFTKPLNLPFLEVDSIGDIAEPAELGPNGQWNEEGTLHVQIYIPRGFGSEPGRQLAQKIVRIFRAVREGPVIYRRTSIGAGEKVIEGAGNWWRLPVYIDWEYQDRPA